MCPVKGHNYSFLHLLGLFCLIETLFYLQLFFFILLACFALAYKSPAFFMFAGVFGLIAALAIASDGISFNTGAEGLVDTSTGDFNITTTYTNYTITNDDVVNTWYLSFLALGMFFLGIGLAVSVYNVYSRRSSK